jgi:hypothetical protein
MCLEKKAQHSTPTSKLHPNCKVWWREHDDLVLLCCLRTACHHQRKNYQDILQENVRLSVCQLKLNRSWVMQQDNNPKHRSNQQQNGFNRKDAFWSGPVRVLTST